MLQTKGAFPIKEFVSNYSEFLIILYGILIMWLNIDYLMDHRKIKKELEELVPEDEEEMLLEPGSISIMLMRIGFDFIRRWLIYLLAIVITENIIVIVISIILFFISLYDILFNYSLAKVTRSRIPLYLIVTDTIFISVFIIYLFFYYQII